MTTPTSVLDFGEVTVTLPQTLVHVLKKLGSEKYIKWFPVFSLSTKSGDISYQIYSNAISDDEPEVETAEQDAPQTDADADIDAEVEDMSDSLEQNNTVVVRCGDEVNVFEYDDFWDEIEKVKLPSKLRKLSNFKFYDESSHVGVVRARGTNQTLVSLDSGCVEEVRGSKGKTKAVVVPLFECDLKQFAEFAGSEGIKLLARVF